MAPVIFESHDRGQDLSEAGEARWERTEKSHGFLCVLIRRKHAHSVKLTLDIGEDPLKNYCVCSKFVPAFPLPYLLRLQDLVIIFSTL